MPNPLRDGYDFFITQSLHEKYKGYLQEYKKGNSSTIEKEGMISTECDEIFAGKKNW